jgi:hypothetical protein
MEPWSVLPSIGHALALVGEEGLQLILVFLEVYTMPYSIELIYDLTVIRWSNGDVALVFLLHLRVLLRLTIGTLFSYIHCDYSGHLGQRLLTMRPS